MKLSSALVALLAAFCVPRAAAGDGKSTSIHESHVTTETNTSGRQLQDDDEEEEEDQISFQLKMYWEEGYYWQEENFDRRWCLECDGSCSAGNMLDIDKCGGDRNQRFVYEEVPGSGGGRLKPKSRQDLCWTREGRRYLTLEPCDLNCRQIILGIQYEGRFEMHPNGRPLECLEQHHHPRGGEIVRSKDCEESRGDDTSFWIMINKSGGNYTNYEEKREVLRGGTNITSVGRDVCDDDNQCGLCMGDCDRDRDCQDGLVCMRRDGNEPVPGCNGAELEENSGLDVCYDPTGNYTLPPTEVPTTSPAPSVPAPTSPPVELYGDCEFIYPSAAPSPYPTDEPSRSPSEFPTFFPSASPSSSPTVSAAPTVSVAPSSVPTHEGYCEPDEAGVFGVEASNSVLVDYAYQLVTDSTQDADPQEIVDILAQNMLQSVLPTLFSDNCTEAPSRRLQGNVTYAPSGASTSGGDAPMDNVNCTGTFPNTTDCTVIAASMLVYTNSDNETYSDVLLPVLKEYMDSGSFNDLHPAIVNVTFKNETATEPTTGSSGGVQNPGLFAILGVGVVGVIIGFVVWKKRKDKHTVDEAETGEGASDIVAAKSLPTASIKEQATVYTSGVSNDSLRNDLAEADKTFEVDSDGEEYDQYEC